MSEGEGDDQQAQPSTSALAVTSQLQRLNMQQYKSQPKDHYAFWATQPVAQFSEQMAEQVRSACCMPFGHTCLGHVPCLKYRF